MPKISWLINKLRSDYPQFKFQEDDHDHWSFDQQTIFYDPAQTESPALILHELAHALLGHNSYIQDIELITIERQAWQHAISQLAPKYNVEIADETVETALDSYRDWIHAKSACPNCDQTGLQLDKSNYQCLSCHNKWRVNLGTNTAIRRYIHNQ